MAGPLRGGGGAKGRTIKEKIIFFLTFFSNVPTAIKLEGVWGLGLYFPAIKRGTFFAASLNRCMIEL